MVFYKEIEYLIGIPLEPLRKNGIFVPERRTVVGKLTTAFGILRNFKEFRLSAINSRLMLLTNYSDVILDEWDTPVIFVCNLRSTAADDQSLFPVIHPYLTGGYLQAQAGNLLLRQIF